MVPPKFNPLLLLAFSRSEFSVFCNGNSRQSLHSSPALRTGLISKLQLQGGKYSGLPQGLSAGAPFSDMVSVSIHVLDSSFCDTIILSNRELNVNRYLPRPLKSDRIRRVLKRVKANIHKHAKLIAVLGPDPELEFLLSLICRKIGSAHM